MKKLYAHLVLWLARPMTNACVERRLSDSALSARIENVCGAVAANAAAISAETTARARARLVAGNEVSAAANLEWASRKVVERRSLSEDEVRAMFAVRKILLGGSSADMTIRERVAVGADPWCSSRNWEDAVVRQACWRAVLRRLPDDVQQHFVEFGLA